MGFQSSPLSEIKDQQIRSQFSQKKHNIIKYKRNSIPGKEQQAKIGRRRRQTTEAAGRPPPLHIPQEIRLFNLKFDPVAHKVGTFMDPCGRNCGEKPIGEGEGRSKARIWMGLRREMSTSSALGFQRDCRFRRLGAVSRYGLGRGACRTARVYNFHPRTQQTFMRHFLKPS